MARTRLALLLAIALLAMLLMACVIDDLDIDRSDWQPTPTWCPTATAVPYRDSRHPGKP